MSKNIKYVKVYDKLFEMIQNQTFPPGSQLPAEKDLAESMGVSRMTLRKALSLLQEDNLITNKAGIGSFVNDGTTDTETPVGELFGHPVHKCCTQHLNHVELSLRIEPPTSSITKSLQKQSAAVVIADRWYKHENTPCAYSLSFIPIEVISQEQLDLNDKNNLLNYLENNVYKKSNGVNYIFLHSTAGNFTSIKYALSGKSSFILVHETIYDDNKQVLVSSKHYIPIELFKLELHVDSSSSLRKEKTPQD